MKNLLLLLSLFPLAAQAVDLSLVGTANLERPRVESAAGTVISSGGLGMGFGALLDLSSDSLLGFQTGVLLINRKITAGSESFSFSRIQIPTLLRITALPILSFGAGAYAELPMGEIGYERGAVQSSSSYDAQGFDSTDFGLVASAAADFPLAPLMGIVIDLRYCLGLKDYDKLAADSRKWGGFQILAGLKLGL